MSPGLSGRGSKDSLSVAGHQSERTMEAGRLPPASLTRELALPRDMNSSGGALSVRLRVDLGNGGRKGGREGGRERERKKDGGRDGGREGGNEGGMGGRGDGGREGGREGGEGGRRGTCNGG